MDPIRNIATGTICLLDAIGGLLTLFGLSASYLFFNEHFGWTLGCFQIVIWYVLLLNLFSWFNFIFIKPYKYIPLFILSIANLGYCLAIGIAIKAACLVATPITTAYFLIETLIILSLAVLEWKRARQIKNELAAH
ncbi:MAG: hypothetical protein RIQ89_1418 [Bacteroidota bacterium]|jgi:hypothetical protein